MADKTKVIGFRLKVDTLNELDEMRKKEYGNVIKLNKYIQVVLDKHIEYGKDKNKKVRK